MPLNISIRCRFDEIKNDFFVKMSRQIYEKSPNFRALCTSIFFKTYLGFQRLSSFPNLEKSTNLMV